MKSKNKEATKIPKGKRVVREGIVAYMVDDMQPSRLSPGIMKKIERLEERIKIAGIPGQPKDK